MLIDQFRQLSRNQLPRPRRDLKLKSTERFQTGSDPSINDITRVSQAVLLPTIADFVPTLPIRFQAVESVWKNHRKADVERFPNRERAEYFILNSLRGVGFVWSISRV